MNAKAPIADSNQGVVDAWKVTYQFVGNNHSLRSNTLVFYAATATAATGLAEAFLKENNIKYLKIISTTHA